MLAGKRPPGKRVVVHDGEGYYAGPGIAELLAAEGFDVELVTLLEHVASAADETLEGPLLRQHLHDAGVRQRAGSTIAAIEPGGVRGADELGVPFELEADGVVLATQRLSNEALYLELREDEEALRAEGVEAVYRIGDCAAPRIPAEAVFDGHRLAREIDSENPAWPLPAKRERLVLEPA
jgi:dimethylamine/trimethylamine dehydrogenase